MPERDDGWLMGALAAQGAYRGEMPWTGWPQSPPPELPDAGGAQMGAIANTLRRVVPAVAEHVAESFRVPANYARDNPEPPGSDTWQQLENIKADRAAQWAPDWAMNVLGLNRLGGGVKGGAAKMGDVADLAQPAPVAQAIRREPVVRGRSGRPVETAPLPIGTEQAILDIGYGRAMGPPAIKSFDELRNLLGQHDTAYVRWSASPEHDMTPGAVSRDYQSGQVHAGLSAQAVDRDFSDNHLFAFLRDYGYLRSKGNEAAMPRLYAGKLVGKDSDFADSIAPNKYLGTLSPDFVKFIDNETNLQRMNLTADLAKGRKALELQASSPPDNIPVWTPERVKEIETRLAKLGGPVEMPGTRPPQPVMQAAQRQGPAQPKMGELADQTGMNMLQDVLRRTTNKGIIDALPPPPRTHGERIAARTKGMSDTDVLNSDELWAMTRDLMAHRADAGSPVAFSRAFSDLASRRLGRPLTAEEMSTALLEGTRAGVVTPRKLYEPERMSGVVAQDRYGAQP